MWAFWLCTDDRRPALSPRPEGLQSPVKSVVTSVETPSAKNETNVICILGSFGDECYAFLLYVFCEGLF